MEDWDDNYEPTEVSNSGKIFGGRGRGFIPASKKSSTLTPGYSQRKNYKINSDFEDNNEPSYHNEYNYLSSGNNKQYKSHSNDFEDIDEPYYQGEYDHMGLDSSKKNRGDSGHEKKGRGFRNNERENGFSERKGRGKYNSDDWGDSAHERKGRGPRNNDEKENGFNDKKGRGPRNNEKGECDFEGKRGRGPSRDDDKTQRKPKSLYVPEEPTDDENQMFSSGISSGINFNKYDDIKVNVSGENPPRPINSFEEAGLRTSVLDLIKKCIYSKPTPIQKYSIPIIMDKRDMMACAQTGSGKTAAFLIPIINSLLEGRKDLNKDGPCKPQALIVSPTRELTIQIFNEARKFSHGTFLKIAISYGGTSVRHQMDNLVKGCHILVATPGRLIDFLNKSKIELSELQFFVLDEADRMLDMGFLPNMETLLTHNSMVPTGQRQTLMFSATFPEEIQRLARDFLSDYLFVAVGIVGGACSDVEQKFYSVTKFEKRNKLVELLTSMDKTKCLVFVEQKRTTDFIATFLCEKNLPATSIHGNREQREREEALRDFKSGKMHILVATSVAARGLDIKNVAHVVNFDLPKSIDEYVHRIGRTGRVGNRGLASSFYDPSQDKPLASDLVKILTQAGQSVPDFLKNEITGGGSYSCPSKFGGRDCRSNDYEQGFGSAQETVFEEEVWS